MSGKAAMTTTSARRADRISRDCRDTIPPIAPLKRAESAIKPTVFSHMADDSGRIVLQPPGDANARVVAGHAAGKSAATGVML
jgi:hypothetical protein